MMLQDFCGGYRHGKVDKNLRRFRQSIIADAQAEEIKQFLRSLQCEGGNDDNSTTPEGIRHGVIELLDGRPQGLVQPVTVSGFHHHGGCGRGRRGIAQQRAARLAKASSWPAQPRAPYMVGRPLRKKRSGALGQIKFGLAEEPASERSSYSIRLLHRRSS